MLRGATILRSIAVYEVEKNQQTIACKYSFVKVFQNEQVLRGFAEGFFLTARFSALYSTGGIANPIQDMKMTVLYPVQ